VLLHALSTDQVALFHGPGACLLLETPIGKLAVKGYVDWHFLYYLLNDCIANKESLGLSNANRLLCIANCLWAEVGRCIIVITARRESKSVGVGLGFRV
jgi:hypothetical protein